MSLSGQQRKRLREALIDAFPTSASLEQMLSYQLNKSLEEIAGEGSLQDIVFKLIQVAESQGWINDLVRAAREANPGNQNLQTIAQELLPESAAIPFIQQQKNQKTLNSTTLAVMTRQNFLKWAGLGGAGLVTVVVGHEIFISINPKPISQNFQVVTVNSRGEITSKRPSQAKFFPEDLGNGITLDMVEIPAGSFKMGTKEEEIERLVQKFKGGEDFRREKPQHEVTVKSFLMGKYQVTQAQWEKVVALPKVKVNLKANPSHSIGDNRPVENVSWDDAVEFCARLSKHTNKQYRLPSEAEWEYACRAGTNTPFHFGGTITTELANYKGDSTYAFEPKGKNRGETIEVGSFSPNSFGLYDMHGNVWEWCQDSWYQKSYEELPSDGSPWINNDDKLHVLRGGSWLTVPEACRSAYRNANFGGPQDPYVGFRVVCTAPRTL
jgi:formylglycine-generating enzyme required for sulfatase activity